MLRSMKARDWPQVIRERYRALVSRASAGSTMREIAQAAGVVEVEVMPAWAWGNRSTFGLGSMHATRAGFWVAMPSDLTDQETQLVLGHEVGHTLFYDASQIEGDSDLFRRQPLHRDVWVADSLDEERICDEVAVELLSRSRRIR